MKNKTEKDLLLPEIANLFETCFIEIVQNLATKKNFKKGEFACKVWPDSTLYVARNRWAYMRGTGTRKEKPLYCTLSDAYRMAKVLGLQISYVVLQAENLAEKKLEENKQITPSKRTRKPTDQTQ